MQMRTASLSKSCGVDSIVVIHNAEQKLCPNKKKSLLLSRDGVDGFSKLFINAYAFCAYFWVRPRIIALEA